jgi:hypothetical protein
MPIPDAGKIRKFKSFHANLEHMNPQVTTFPRPVHFDEILYDPQVDPSEGREKLEPFFKDMDALVAEHMSEVEIKRGKQFFDPKGNRITSRTTRFLLDDVRDELNNGLRTDPRMVKATVGAYEANAPEALRYYKGKENQIMPALPDWVDYGTLMDGFEYRDGKLHVYNMRPTLSTIIQGARLPGMPKGIIDPPSVSLHLMTKDKNILLGLRGGRNRPYTMMQPAGSISQRIDAQAPFRSNPIFDSVNNQSAAELGFTPINPDGSYNQHVKDLSVEGVIYENLVGGNRLFVVLIDTDVERRDFEEKYSKIAPNGYEHSRYKTFQNDIPGIRSVLLQHDLPYRDEILNKTHSEGYGEKDHLEDIMRYSGFGDREVEIVRTDPRRYIDYAPMLKPGKLSLICHAKTIDPSFEYTLRYDM